MSISLQNLIDHGHGKKLASGNSEIKEVHSNVPWPGTEGWGKQEVVGQRVQIFSCKMNKSEAVIYSMVTTVSNTELHI